MVATAEDILFLFKSKRRRLEEEKHAFVKRNSAYNKNDTCENFEIVATAAREMLKSFGGLRCIKTIVIRISNPKCV